MANGLLIPDEWTEKIIDSVLEDTPGLREDIFILDGFPRTVAAAGHLLKTMDRLEIPVIKALHLFITKEQMKARAQERGRLDKLASIDEVVLSVMEALGLPRYLMDLRSN